MSTLEIPTTLPVDYLSVSSVNTYLRCPESWRRKYIDREYEPPSGQMILGSAVGAAEAQSDLEQIETGDRLTVDQVVDAFSDEWEDRTGREEIDWSGSKPGELKDSGVGVVQAYNTEIAPSLVAVSAEREFNLELEGVEWGFRGFIDLETADGVVVDRKVKAKRLGQGEANTDLQPTAYLLARRAEGNPAPRFDYHTMVRTKQPYAEVVTTARSDRQLDAFTDRLYQVAAEIAWRLESGVWGGAVPGSWWCSERFCGFWRSCPMGGAR